VTDLRFEGGVETMSATNQKHRILIVDDEPDIRNLLAPRFTKVGYSVEVCGDGDEALKLLTGEHFDAVLTDINMPRMSGVELVTKAKMNSVNRAIHILVMSGAAENECVEKLTQLGIAELVAKPFRVEVLLNRISELLAVSIERKKMPRQQFLDCFLTATKEVFGHYAQRSLEVGTIESNSVTSVSGDVSASISFSGGGFVGFVSIILAQAFVDILEENIFGNINIDVDNSVIADLVGEMINQVAGRAQLHLRGLETEISAGLPSVCVGPGHTLFQRSRIPIILIPLSLDGGALCHLEVCVTGLAATPAVRT
jgi:CheY-like chemotaxis protein/CheY-specific phosphatase CheX